MRKFLLPSSRACPQAASLAAPLAGVALLLLGAGCASHDAPVPQDTRPAYDEGPEVNEDGQIVSPKFSANSQDGARYSALQLLLKYDANHDGKLTRAELEAGLKADFAVADSDHDGKLELEEYRAVNDARWKEQGAASSPLVDWNGDGVVDFDEFAAAPRTLFEQLDGNGAGVVDLRKFDPRQKPTPQGPQSGKPDASPSGDSGSHGKRGGRGGRPGG